MKICTYNIGDYFIETYTNVLSKHEMEGECVICSKNGANTFISKLKAKPPSQISFKLCFRCTEKYHFDSDDKDLVKKSIAFIKMKGCLEEPSVKGF